MLDVDGRQVTVGAAVKTVVFDLGVVRFELALLVVDAQRDAEGVVEHLAVVERRLRAGIARQLLMAGFQLAAQAAAVTVEGRGRFDDDAATDRITRHVRGGRLDHTQALG